ncbi:MAG TPA: DUF1559 domain-containing protein, partial [Gemmataceae bacterium]|nr:DUF1559 domain-containing protein [Gemmataceae bacterium]
SPPGMNYQYSPWGDYFAGTGLGANPMVGQVVKTYSCPSDSRTLISKGGLGINGNIAFCGLVGCSGSGVPGFDPSWTNYPDPDIPAFYVYDGILSNDSQTRIADITDGTSNTLMVGERPPSFDLNFGWMFAGAGYNNQGIGDVLLGAYEQGYLTYAITAGWKNPAGSPCSAANIGFQAGQVRNQCDQMHWWSFHTGGCNFVFGDGSVHFIAFGTPPAVMVALSTMASGEVVSLP